MSPPVFGVQEVPEAGASVVLDGPEGRHAATVRRMRVGERLLLTDGHGGVADCTVTVVGRDRLDLHVSERRQQDPASPPVTVVQALAKGDRAELAVELTTEAGVDVLVPWQAARCVALWNADRAERGAQRWRAVAAQAAKQSRRAHVPGVHELHSTTGVAALVRATIDGGGIALLLHEAAAAGLGALELTGVRSVLLVVGPEGGLDDAEVAALSAAGARAVHLGPTVLRTSTAAAVALGALGVLTARWDRPPLV